MEHKIKGKNYCRCDTPDENGRRSECGLPDVQCPSCSQKDVIDALADENVELRKALADLLECKGTHTSDKECVINAKRLLNK